jgi:CysZ protein
MNILAPLGRALSQLNDPVFQRVVWRSLAWSAACFVALIGIAVWLVNHLLALHGWWAWAAGLLGGIGAALLAFWLFLPVAAVIGTLFMERIAAAVERRFYPTMPPPHGAPFAVQVWDGLAVGARILLFNLLALVLALAIPGAGLILAWAIGAFAIGRGMFVAVAMRRMSRSEAESLYRRERATVLTQGGVMALACYLPLLNLLLPVIGTAAMVHVLDSAMSADGTRRAF